MRIAVASGKGGTGKTTVSTNLARVIAKNRPVQYVDCDVEEPNGHLFLKPEIANTVKVKVRIPEIDESLCTHCGECSAFCAYNALASLKNSTLVFPELCHSCGGCFLICPANAIREVGKDIGIVREGKSMEVLFLDGVLKVGQAQSPPLIREIHSRISSDCLVIVDAPPGASCPVVSALRGADLVVMVAEPTPFGLNDLSLALDMVKLMNLRFGVLINRADSGDSSLESFCAQHSIPVLGRIPFDRRIAECYSTGELAVDALSDIGAHFNEIADRLMMELDS